MKRIFIVAIVIIASISTLLGQPQDRHREGDFQQFQTQLIIKQLGIEESKKEAFEKIYTQYSTQMQKLRPQHRRGQEQQTESEVEAQILKSFEIAEQTTALKKEYYEHFKTILSPHQILKMYNIERQVNERINSEMQNRAKGGRPREGE